MTPINVWKRNLQGEVTWRYTGEILNRGADFVTLEARFNRDDMPFMDVTLKRDDRFVETFFTECWYNIFEIHDRDDDQLKGWYCNIGKPTVWDTPDTISYVDLALDLWIAADGTQTILDEDEFAALELDQTTRAEAIRWLEELKRRMKTEIERMKSEG